MILYLICIKELHGALKMISITVFISVLVTHSFRHAIAECYFLMYLSKYIYSSARRALNEAGRASDVARIATQSVLHIVDEFHLL